MRKITFGDRVRYAFDNTMSRGPIALIGWLFLLSALLILVAAVVLSITGIAPAGDSGQPGFAGLLWSSLMHTMDSGTVAGDTGSPAFLLLMFLVTLGGIFLVSILIGVLTSGIEGRLEDLRKGRSFVVETGHTVILGWSPQVFGIISELVLANANKPRSSIAILADQGKVEMEDEIRAKVGSTGKTRVVCRSGHPADMANLEVVNPHGARSIIILAPETANPDSSVIKTILALTNHPQRRPEPYHIVAEIRDPKNMDVARMVGRDEVELVLVGDLIARITVQTCQQSGLSVVYTELLDFGGDEIYFQEEPGLVGKTFGEAIFSYVSSALIGLRTADGKVLLKPPLDQQIQAGDKVIAISEDDDTVRLGGTPTIDTAAIREQRTHQPTPTHTLILGWNERGPTIVRELNSYVTANSSVTIVADETAIDADTAQEFAGLTNQQVSLHEGDITDRRLLDTLDLPRYQHVIVLSAAEGLDPQEADARTLVTLLHLRDIAVRTGNNFSIVSEMLDIRNRDLAEVTQADDFIVSDKLVGLMLSQVSEQKELAAVFADLFDPEGSEIYLKPAIDYVEPGKAINFYTVLEAARRRDEVAIGYRVEADSTNAARAYGIHVNPSKPEQITFAEGDMVIVLAES